MRRRDFIAGVTAAGAWSCFHDLVRTVGRELRGAYLDDVGAFRGEQLLHFGGGHDFGYRLMQPLHDRLGCAADRHDPDPVRRLVARNAGLGHGRHLRQGRAPRQAADTEGFQLTGANMADARSHRAECRIGVAADHIDQGGTRAAERNVQDVDIGGDLEQLPGQMQEGANAGRGVLQFAGLLPGQRTSSLMLFAGRPGLTVTTFGAATSMEIGAKDFSGS